VIHRILFRPQTPIPPGQTVDSNEIDVGGAQQVTVRVGIQGAVADVEYEIVFIHREASGGAAFVPVQTDTFSPHEGDPDSASMLTSVQVIAPILLVALTNKGSEPASTFHSWVYGVRFGAG
jgi:hypothetical protein